MTSDKTIKNRRYINLRPNQVEGILPEYFSTNYPQFISLLEKYYEFQDQSDSTELLKHLFATRDINETDILLLKYIEDELLLGEAYFEGFGETDAELRAAANFSNVLFRSKGTKFAIEWFFRSFYGVDAEVVYPKENIFKVGNNGSTIGVSSQHYLTNDKLYQTYALLIKSEIPISKWEDVFKLFAHPAGMYLGGEVQITADIKNELRSLIFSEAETTPTYSISITPSTTEDEGTTFTATVSEGDSDTALFWYIENVTTDSDDFGYVIADSTSPNYVDMPSGSGTFDVITTLDIDEAEGNETFNIIVKDEEGRLKSSSTITLQNVVATYSLFAKLNPEDSEGSVVEAPTTSLTDVIDSDVPYHYWQMDDIAGSSTLSDRVGNFDLRVNSPGKIDGTSSRADGSGTSHVLTHNSSSGAIYQSTLAGAEAVMNLTQDFTMAFAMRNTAIGNTTQYIFDKYQSGGSNSEYHLYLQGSVGNPTELWFPIYQSNGTLRNQLLVSDLETGGWDVDNQWRWFSIKMDYSGTGLLTCKVDNVIIGSVNVSSWSGSWRNNTNSRYGVLFEQVRGGLDDFAFFQTALDSDAETRQYEAWSTVAPSSSGLTGNEGQTFYFDVTGTNIPNNGNIVLDWYVDPIDTSDSDFVFGGSPPLTGSPSQVQLLNGEGTFSLDTRIDNVSDDGEQFKVIIRTPLDAMDRDSATITLTNVVPTFNVTASDLVEGNNLLVSVECDSVQIGNSVEWSMTGAASSDSRVPSTSGSFSLTGINDTYTLLTTTVDDAYQGSVAGTVTVTSSEFYTPDITNNDTFNILDADPVYTITPDPATAGEGDTVTFDIGGTNIPNGTIYWHVEHIDTTDADFSSTPPSFVTRLSITMSGGVSSPSPSVTFANNADSLDEDFWFVLTNVSGTELTRLRYTIISQTYSIVPSTTSLDENTDTLNVTFNSSQDGTYYYWIDGTNIDASDFSAGYYSASSRGVLNISSGSDVETITTNADKVREGNETFVINMSRTSSGGVVSQSSAITITDTSLPTYTLSAPDVVEGSTQSVLITPNSNDTENVFVQVSGSASAQFTTTTDTVSISSSPVNVNFNTTSSTTYSGGLGGVVQIYLDSAGGQLLDSDNFVLTDATASYNLVTNKTNDSANEGDTIEFTFSGTNIPNGTYYYSIPADIATATVDAFSPSGGSILYLDDTTGFVNGMVSSTIGASGSITNVSASSITLSAPLSKNFNADEQVTFGDSDTLNAYDAPSALFSVTSNSGTFEVVSQPDNNADDRTDTFSVFDDFDGNLLKSRAITINDPDSLPQVQLLSTFGVSQTLESPASPTAEIEFFTSGTYGGNPPNSPTVDGQWLDDVSGLPTDAGNYEIFATIVSSSGNIGSATGDFGTWEDLNVTQSWSITTITFDAETNQSGQRVIDITVREKANTSNSATMRVTLNVTSQGDAPLE